VRCSSALGATSEVQKKITVSRKIARIDLLTNSKVYLRWAARIRANYNV
jgi:hypothetical protein